VNANALPLKSLSALVLALAVAGCAPVAPILGGKTPARAHPRADGARAERAQPPSRPARTERAEKATPERADVALREGIELFNDGDYNGAIRRLSSAEITGAPLRTRVNALKYMAFSYCVTGRQMVCREHFVRAIRLDPNFKLATGEQGHPLWGPEFVAAKRAVEN
jgi:hypothetical protein